MSDFLKYLGMDEEDEALARKLVSPADMAAQGASSMGESAGRVLSGLGAKLDARLGTTGYRLDEASPDVFRKMPDNHERSPGAPLDRRGLFEMLGHAVPNVAAVVGGNTLPVSGPAMPGAVAAFPSPKQSLARMKEEAVFRDMMEAKGAKPVTPSPVDGSLAARRPDLRVANKAQEADDAFRLDDAEAHNVDMSRRTGDSRTAPHDFQHTQHLADAEARNSQVSDKLEAPPLGPAEPGASELERYLSGLFGPKAAE